MDAVAETQQHTETELNRGTVTDILAVCMCIKVRIAAMIPMTHLRPLGIRDKVKAGPKELLNSVSRSLLPVLS
jgi:hypothetical protein